MTTVSNDSDTADQIRQQIQLLIENAPKQVKGRPPTSIEIEEQQKFKADVKDFISRLPPNESNVRLTYKAVMKQVKETQNPKTTTKSTRPKQELKQPNKKSKEDEKKQQPDCLDHFFANNNGGGSDNNTAHVVDYLCVLDFEATCNRDGPRPVPQEIIEFPTVLINAQTGQIEDTFHYYIRPDVHPILPPFCTELTGITQEMVDTGISLDEALEKHQEWLDHHNLISEGEDPFHQVDEHQSSEGNDKNRERKRRFLYVTCGDWDLKTCLTKQLQYHGKETPQRFKAWINQKYAYLNVYPQQKNVRGMTDMLDQLGLELEGRHHSGIDDCKNITRICAKMLHDGWVPRPTWSAVNAGSKIYWEYYKDRRDWPSLDEAKSVPPQLRHYKKVLLIRHGQSLGQATSTLKERKNNPGLKDCGLTEKGRDEATAVADLLGPELLDSIQLVVSSPVTRALSTAILAFPNHRILVDYDIAESSVSGHKLPENECRSIDAVLTDIAADMSPIHRGSDRTVGIDIDSLRPDGWPNPTGKESLAKRIRNSLKNLYDDTTTDDSSIIAIVGRSNVIKQMVNVRKKGNLAPENAVPIKCALFRNGDLRLV